MGQPLTGGTFTVITAVLLVPFSVAWGANTIHVPADPLTFHAAINAAADGDNVLVAPGTYQENIDFHGKAITVTICAGPLFDSSCGTDQTGASGDISADPLLFEGAKNFPSLIGSPEIDAGSNSAPGLPGPDLKNFSLWETVLRGFDAKLYGK